MGGAVAISLARLGVGRFVVTDPGSFDPPDINRQWGADQSTLGRNKAEVYRDWIREINPRADVQAHTAGITPANVDLLVAEADLVIDSLDVSVDLALRNRMYTVAHERGIHTVTVPHVGFGAMLVISNPGVMSLDPFMKILGPAIKRGVLPPFFRSFYAPFTLDALERDLTSGKVPSVVSGPAVGTALATVESFILLVDGVFHVGRKAVCLPYVLLMDPLTLSYRQIHIEELAG